MTSPKPGTPTKHNQEPLEDADHEFDQRYSSEDFKKSKVECICPGCARIHTLKMRWIGRGVPRKFCQSCRDRETPLDGDE